MKKKTANLSVVKNTETVTQRKSFADTEKENEKFKITPREARVRAHALRVELESYLAQLDAVPYDLPTNGLPTCLDWSQRKYHVQLIEDLNPLINAIFERCDTTAKAHGVNEEFDYNSQLFDLKMMAGETGYYIGVLAGVMFAGASKETVDRFERGLFYAMKSNNRVVKDTRHD